MEKKKYFIVSADALPEVFVKVAEAKRMLQVGEASTVGQAAAMERQPVQPGSAAGAEGRPGSAMDRMRRQTQEAVRPR